MRSLRRFGLLSAIVPALALAGCSDDPSGPGALELRVSANVALGAAVVELEGEGLRSVEQPASGWVELVPVAPRAGVPVHRLVVIREEPGVLAVRLQVTDVATVRPVATVLDASDGNDQSLPSLSSVRVSIDP